MMSGQTMIFQREFYPEANFVASKGFIQRFSERHNLKCITLHGEKQSADTDAVEPFLAEMAEIQKEYSLDQIYNADESGLVFKSLPNTTMSTLEERTQRTKRKESHSYPAQMQAPRMSYR